MVGVTTLTFPGALLSRPFCSVVRQVDRCSWFKVHFAARPPAGEGLPDRFNQHRSPPHDGGGSKNGGEFHRHDRHDRHVPDFVTIKMTMMTMGMPMMTMG